MKLNQIGKQHTFESVQKSLNSRFGYTFETSNLTLKKATKMLSAMNESLEKFRQTAGYANAERNPEFLKRLTIAEALSLYIQEKETATEKLTESDASTAEVLLASKDFVDRMQKMVEDISKMLNEDLYPLVDDMRSEVGSEVAEAFAAKAKATLEQALTDVTTAREGLDLASRIIAGEEAPDMGDSDSDLSDEIASNAVDDLDLDVDSDVETDDEPADDEPADEFDASVAASGGEAELGREKRD
jgi:hypothetical protein